MTATSNIETPVRPTTVVVDTDAALFREAFNRRSFAFPHLLANHPLFTIPRLADAAQAILDKGDTGRFVVFDAKSFEADTGFGATFRTRSVVGKRAPFARGAHLAEDIQR